MAGVDLHIHSNRSDGLTSPAEIARQTVSAGLTCISLTDHNTVDGLAELRTGLKGTAVRSVDGVELSTCCGAAGEIHLLGYGINPENARLLSTLARMNSWKREQLRRMIDALGRCGITLDEREVFDLPPGQYVGRLYLARLLVSKGLVRTTRDAFTRYLGQGGQAYVPAETLSPQECIEGIHNADGLAVLGHPSVQQLDAVVGLLAEAGLDGIEVYRRGTKGDEELYAEAVARDFGLLVTGGSDWHGRPCDGSLGEFSLAREKLAAFLERLDARGARGAGEAEDC